ncbi:MAG TPA: MinD/ParA family protein [Phycisphaerae bacterium]|nr:MinD/ParA family protein [Phycisphaerae bacterium]
MSRAAIQSGPARTGPPVAAFYPAAADGESCRPCLSASRADPQPAATDLPTGQAGAGPIRRIPRDLRTRARVLAVVSGKGGVGKTNIAVNLALSLAAAGRRVLLVDTDLGLANVDLILGRRPRAGLGHVLAGRLPLEAIIQEGPAGLRWIPGASHIPAVARMEARRREEILDGLAALETQHDFLLLDTPAGIGPGVLQVARQADELLLVTTPEPTAIMDAYALLKAVAADGAGPCLPCPGGQATGGSLGRTCLPDRQVRLIVNMVAHRRDGVRVHERLAETAGRFLGISVSLLGHIFCGGHVGRAVQKQEPLLTAYPHSQAAWCIKQLAGAVLEGPEGRPAGRFAPALPVGRFFRRLANLGAAG